MGPNLEFSLDDFSPDVQDAIREGAAAAHRKIEDRGNKLGSTVNGWEYTPPMGNYGEDYLFRSAVAWKFIYTNSPEEALYPIANTPEKILALGEEGLKQYIKTIGLFNSKAKNTIATCRILVEQHNSEVPEDRAHTLGGFLRAPSGG